ncbi:helix-turn-helix domain-containing protein [Rhizobium azibense]|uniref:helix-turn-helix domain-containing protein n=1 Tax=Rhizobium azibense TaxID=1136135 RepID=UPI003CCB5902
MSTLKHIRKNVFRLRQDEFAQIAGVHQATVSKWEAEILYPDFKNLVSIRSEARSRDLDWNDAWFFEIPVEGACVERNDCPA